MEIKNLKKTAKRILTAIKNKENIIIYGDADLDGTASVIILKEAIESLPRPKKLGRGEGGKISSIYFVNRDKEGYGINKKALNFLKSKAPALFITLDLGITNFAEVKIAQKMGFEVIIIDHHQVLDTLPDASIIVDPKQKGDRYLFKQLATVGIVYRLVKALFTNKLSRALDDSFLELVALGTIADMMPRVEENKTYIEQGIELLKITQRPGLKVFLEMNHSNNLKEKVYRIIYTLNVSQNKKHLTEAYLLLTCKDKKEIKKLKDNLLKRAEERHLQIREIAAEVETRIFESSSPIVFEGDAAWSNALIGAVASRVCNKYKKPSFIYKKMKDKSMGAVRMPGDTDAVKAMSACAKLLVTFGGHPPAAGFTVKNENLEKFKECLIKYFENIDK